MLFRSAGSHAYDYSDYVAPTAPPADRQYGDVTRIERIDWSKRPPMDHPQAQYGEDGSSTSRGAPEMHDPYDPNANDADSIQPAAGRFGGSDYGGSPHGSPDTSEYNDSPYFDDDGHPVAPAGDFEREAGDRSSSYANFLASANKQIARQAGNTRDPFFQ